MSRVLILQIVYFDSNVSKAVSYLRGLGSRFAPQGLDFSIWWFHVRFVVDQVAGYFSWVSSVFPSWTWFCYSPILTLRFLLKYAIALIRRLIIVASLFELWASSLSQYFAGYRRREAIFNIFRGPHVKIVAQRQVIVTGFGKYQDIFLNYIMSFS